VWQESTKSGEDVLEGNVSQIERGDLTAVWGQFFIKNKLLFESFDPVNWILKK